MLDWFSEVFGNSKFDFIFSYIFSVTKQIRKASNWKKWNWRWPNLTERSKAVMGLRNERSRLKVMEGMWNRARFEGKCRLRWRSDGVLVVGGVRIRVWSVPAIGTVHSVLYIHSQRREWESTCKLCVLQNI